MLSKSERIKNEKDFSRIFRKGKSVREGFLILKWIENGMPKTRLAVSVSKKISKKATIRNKLKRRLVSIAEKNLEKTAESMDFLITVLPGMEGKEFKETKEMLDRLFLKSGTMKR